MWFTVGSVLQKMLTHENSALIFLLSFTRQQTKGYLYKTTALFKSFPLVSRASGLRPPFLKRGKPNLFDVSSATLEHFTNRLEINAQRNRIVPLGKKCSSLTLFAMTHLNRGEVVMCNYSHPICVLQGGGSH